MKTNAAIAEIAAQIASMYTYIGIGDSSAEEAGTHTDLQAAVNKKRKSATVTLTTTDVTNDTVHWAVSLSKADALTGAWIIAEIAVFSAVSGGTMFFRKKLTVPKSVNWDDDDTATLSCDYQVK